MTDWIAQQWMARQQTPLGALPTDIQNMMANLLSEPALGALARTSHATGEVPLVSLRRRRAALQQRYCPAPAQCLHALLDAIERDDRISTAVICASRRLDTGTLLIDADRSLDDAEYTDAHTAASNDESALQHAQRLLVSYASLESDVDAADRLRPAGIAVWRLAPSALDALLWCSALPYDTYWDVLAERALYPYDDAETDELLCEVYTRLRERVDDPLAQLTDEQREREPRRVLRRQLLVARCMRAPGTRPVDAMCALLPLARTNAGRCDALAVHALTHNDTLLLRYLCENGALRTDEPLSVSATESLRPLHVAMRAPPSHRNQSSMVGALYEVAPHCGGSVYYSHKFADLYALVRARYRSRRPPFLQEYEIDYYGEMLDKLERVAPADTSAEQHAAEQLRTLLARASDDD